MTGGIDLAVLPRLFEAFVTTKEPGSVFTIRLPAANDTLVAVAA